MDFEISPEQQAVVDVTRRFAEERLAPGYQERERAGRIDRSLVSEMGELGLIGVELPAHAGGLAYGHVTTGLIVEGIAAGDFNVAYIPILGSLCGQIIVRHGDSRLAAAHVTDMCRGRNVTAIALTEPGSGSDAANLRLNARRDGNCYVIDGEKTSISLADQADSAVIFARTGEAPGARGISSLLVDLHAPGITRTHFSDVGEKCIGRGSIFFDGVRVPVTQLLGAPGAGFTHVMEGFDFSRALIALQCLAPATASLAETWRYVGERKSFGQPIGSNQGVSFPLAEAETKLEAARLLCLKTLWLKDCGKPHTAEAAMCKWWAPKLAFEIIHQCLLLHGHGGYSTDLPFEQRLRDVMGLQIGDGTEQIMKMIIARHKSGLRG